MPDLEELPPPPPNPTQCDQYWVDGAWRIWCEIDLAGPCEGCPEKPALRSHPMPRDPARIPGVLAQVQRLWEAYPDLRLGQLIENLAQGSVYHVEDDELVREAGLVLAFGWAREGEK